MKNIGKRVKQIRELLKISQETLANELGITKQAISNIEHSKCYPNIALLHKLYTDYGVNINYIITGRGDIYVDNNSSKQSLKKSLLKEVEHFLDSRGIK